MKAEEKPRMPTVWIIFRDGQYLVELPQLAQEARWSPFGKDAICMTETQAKDVLRLFKDSAAHLIEPDFYKQTPITRHIDFHDHVAVPCETEAA